MKRSPSEGKVTGKDWVALKPWDAFSDYDMYYVGLANEVRKSVVFMTEGGHAQMDSQAANKISCILVSYFEDFINETGLWQVFTQKSEGLTGKPIPFYDLEGYDPDYINAQDLSYLLWHTLSQLNPDAYYAPDHKYIVLAGQTLFYLFEDEIENAPATDFYAKYLDLKEDCSWGDVASIVHWLGQTSFVPGACDLKPKFQNYMEGLVLNKELPEASKAASRLLLFGQETFEMEYASSFLGLTGMDFLLGTVQCSPELADELRTATQSANGMFECIGETQEGFKLKYMGTELEIELTAMDLMGMGKVGGKYLLKVRRWQGKWIRTAIPVLQEDSFEMGDGDQKTPFLLWPEQERLTLRELAEETRLGFLDRFKAPFAEFSNLLKAKDFLNETVNSLLLDKRLQKFPNLVRDFFLAGYTTVEELLKEVEKSLGTSPLCISLRKDLGFSFDGLPLAVKAQMESEMLAEDDQDELFERLLAELEPELSLYCMSHFPVKHVRYPIPQCQLSIADDLLAWLNFYQPASFGDQVRRLSI